jgi:hypothetical protein
MSHKNIYYASNPSTSKFLKLTVSDTRTCPATPYNISLSIKISDDDVEVEDITLKKSVKPSSNVRARRDMSKYFKHGQSICHTIGANNWIGTYDASSNKIIFGGNKYKSLSGFAEAHYKAERPDRFPNANGWKECEYNVFGKWISTYSLRSVH